MLSLSENLSTNYDIKTGYLGISSSVLGVEHAEVMSMEGIEVQLTNGELYGVFYEVESESSDASHEAACFS